jgi:hypothetical protein
MRPSAPAQAAENVRLTAHRAAHCRAASRRAARRAWVLRVLRRARRPNRCATAGNRGARRIGAEGAPREGGTGPLRRPTGRRGRRGRRTARCRAHSRRAARRMWPPRVLQRARRPQPARDGSARAARGSSAGEAARRERRGTCRGRPVRRRPLPRRVAAPHRAHDVAAARELGPPRASWGRRARAGAAARVATRAAARTRTRQFEAARGSRGSPNPPRARAAGRGWPSSGPEEPPTGGCGPPSAPSGCDDGMSGEASAERRRRQYSSGCWWEVMIHGRPRRHRHGRRTGRDRLRLQHPSTRKEDHGQVQGRILRR